MGANLPPLLPLPPRLISFILLTTTLLLTFSSSFCTPVLSSWSDPCMYNRNFLIDLTSRLSSSVIGQDLALDSITQQLEHHLSLSTTYQATKPLVLSFHGRTGTGKTFVSSALSSALFYQSDSSHIYKFHGKRYSSSSQVDENIRDLHKMIVSALSTCPLSLFIFEEIHYMHPSVLDNLIYFFDSQVKIDNAPAHQATQAIYILTSNIGGQALQKLAYDSAKQEISRSDLPYKLISEHLIASLKQQNQLTSLINHAVINHFIPFFPLFKKHVKQCFHAQLLQLAKRMQIDRKIFSLHWDDSLLSYAASFLQYTGPVSDTGCRAVKDTIVSEVVSGLNRQLKQVDEGSWFGITRWNYEDCRIYLDVVENVQMKRVQEEAARKMKAKQEAEGKEAKPIKSVLTGAGAEIVKVRVERLSEAERIETGVGSRTGWRWKGFEENGMAEVGGENKKQRKGSMEEKEAGKVSDPKLKAADELKLELEEEVPAGALKDEL